MPLAQEPSGIVIDPRRYVTAIYGAAAVGKTSWCAQIPGHHFLYTPNAGIEGLSVYGDPILSWSDFIAKATELIEAKKNNFQGQRKVETIVIDVMTDLFIYGGIEVCKTTRFMEKGVAKKYDRIDEVPFGRGFTRTAELLIKNLGVLHSHGFGIFLTSHTKERTVKWANADVTSYGFNLAPSASLMIEAFCGAIGYFVMEEKLSRNAAGEIEKVEQGRFMHWQPGFMRLGKHRLKGFPDQLEFPIDRGWEVYCDAFEETLQKIRTSKANVRDDSTTT